MVGSCSSSPRVIPPLVGSAVRSQSRNGCFGFTTTADRFNIIPMSSLSGRAAFVSVVQSADFWNLDHPSYFCRLNGARNRRVLVQRQMSAPMGVIVEV